MLADARGIMAGNYRLEPVRSTGVGHECGAVAVTIEIVAAAMIRVPNFDLGPLDRVAARIENSSIYSDGHPGLTGLPKLRVVRRVSLIEGPGFIPRRRLSGCGRSLLSDRDCFEGERRRDFQHAKGCAF